MEAAAAALLSDSCCPVADVTLPAFRQHGLNPVSYAFDPCVYVCVCVIHSSAVDKNRRTGRRRTGVLVISVS